MIYLAAAPTISHLPEKIRQCSLPRVVISQSPMDEDGDLVVRDNRQAATLAVRYLIERGHRNIAYIGGGEKGLIRHQRLSGFQNVLKQYGMIWREELTPSCNNDTRAASIATRQLLEKNNTITAVLCHSPDVMIGCTVGIHQIGRTVGKDVFLTQQVALIGFENICHMNLTSPSFTCVSSASEESGRQAATLMVRKLKEPGMPPQKITLSGSLIIRESA